LHLSPVMLWKVAEYVGAHLLAGLLTGIVAGLGARLVMKLVAVAYPDMASGFHLSGVLLLIVMGMMIALGVSLLYLMLKPLHPAFPHNNWWFGLFFLTLFGVPFFASNPADELFGPQAPLAIGLFTCLFLLSGYLLTVCTRYLENRLTPLSSRIAALLLLIPAGFGLWQLGTDWYGTLKEAFQLLR